jgi:hypothetical protein
MAVRHWAIATLSAVLLSVSAASYGQQQEKVTWEEALGYVAHHGTAFSFYGPVAKALGLSDGTTVDSRKLSKPGNPNRDFFVTESAAVLPTTWNSGASPAYTASKEGVLLKATDRNRSIPVPQAVGAFQAEKQWWITAISADRARTGY